ncbi:MAG: diacylglycerol kinase family protein [Patescibacteria group bacterium]
MDSKKEIKAWREIKISKRFLNAFRGMHVFIMTTRHLFLLMFAIAAVIILGFSLKVSNFEWIALVFSIGFVIVSEIFNTAIEIDIDLTSPQYHPFARDTKDVAAAAVLLSIITSIIVGCIVFLPKIFLII